jgi:hypothetical protein
VARKKESNNLRHGHPVPLDGGRVRLRTFHVVEMKRRRRNGFFARLRRAKNDKDERDFRLQNDKNENDVGLGMTKTNVASVKVTTRQLKVLGLFRQDLKRLLMLNIDTSFCIRI